MSFCFPFFFFFVRRARALSASTSTFKTNNNKKTSSSYPARPVDPRQPHGRDLRLLGGLGGKLAVDGVVLQLVVAGRPVLDVGRLAVAAADDAAGRQACASGRPLEGDLSLLGAAALDAHQLGVPVRVGADAHGRDQVHVGGAPGVAGVVALGDDERELGRGGRGFLAAVIVLADFRIDIVDEKGRAGDVPLPRRRRDQQRVRSHEVVHVHVVGRDRLPRVCRHQLRRLRADRDGDVGRERRLEQQVDVDDLARGQRDRGREAPDRELERVVSRGDAGLAASREQGLLRGRGVVVVGGRSRSRRRRKRALAAVVLGCRCRRSRSRSDRFLSGKMVAVLDCGPRGVVGSLLRGVGSVGVRLVAVGVVLGGLRVRRSLVVLMMMRRNVRRRRVVFFLSNFNVSARECGGDGGRMVVRLEGRRRARSNRASSVAGLRRLLRGAADQKEGNRGQRQGGGGARGRAAARSNHRFEIRFFFSARPMLFQKSSRQCKTPRLAFFAFSSQIGKLRSDRDRTRGETGGKQKRGRGRGERTRLRSFSLRSICFFSRSERRD